MSPVFRYGVIGIIGIAVLIFAIQFGILFNTGTTNSEPVLTTKTVYLGGAQFDVLVADTAESRTQGLSGMESLGTYDGMLFVSPASGQRAMWMRGMQFPLDIIWISEEGSVVHIEKNLSPSDTRVFTPATPARYVLEVPAGFATEHGIEVGTRVGF